MSNTVDKIDYLFFKKEGVELLKMLAGNTWSDHGKHDPGITILEELIFGIMDLIHRTNFHIEDLLAPNPSEQNQGAIKPFYRAEEILPCNAVTKWDFLKITLDVAGVKNANIFLNEDPNAIQGGYHVLIELEENIRDTTEESQVLDTVKKRLMAQKNLCEDFFLIAAMQATPISIQAHFEVNHYISYQEAEKIIAQILFELQSFLSPRVHFYSISQLLEQGKTIDQIFTGPLLTQGFLDEEAIKQLKSKSKIYVADLVASATAVPGIKSVLNFGVMIENEQFNTNTIAIPIVMDRFLSLNTARTKITLSYNGANIATDWAKVSSLLDNMKGQDKIKKSYVQKEETFVLEGVYRHLDRYIALQNDLPLLYNVGHEGCSPSETIENQAKAKQLKGYLMFFEQLLTNYLTRLSNFKHDMAIFSPTENKNHILPLKVPNINTVIKAPTDPTHTHNKANEVDLPFMIQRKYLDLKQTTKPLGETYQTDQLGAYANHIDQIAETQKESLQKRSAILDHLLAYFSEKFTTATLNLHTSDSIDDLETINHNKTIFLQDYINISQNRGKAAHFTANSCSGWAAYQPSGLERRIYHNLAIKHSSKRSLHEVIKQSIYVEQSVEQNSFDLFLGQEQEVKLSHFTLKGPYTNILSLALAHGIYEGNYFASKQQEKTYTIKLHIDEEKKHTIEWVPNVAIQTIQEAEANIGEMVGLFKTINELSEGFHLIEHILLRDKDTLNDPQNDPYSFKMTLVFPAWPARFQKALFKDAVEKMVMTESPAHVIVHILWLDLDEMEQFEKAYKKWMHLKAIDQDQKAINNAAALLMASMFHNTNHI